VSTVAEAVSQIRAAPEMAKIPEELTRWPLVEPRYELIDGRLYMVPAPTPGHQRAVRELEHALHRFVSTHHLGEVFFAPCDVVLSELDIVQPDIFFISAARRSILGEKQVEGAPDLIVEVISPSTEQWDRVVKRRLYAQYGVREYWLVDLDAKQVEVLTLKGREYERAGLYGEEETLRSPLLPGLEIELASVFAGP